MRGAWSLALLLALGIPAGKACAWGEEGHRVAGAIATRYLTPEASRQVAYLLRHDRAADKAPSGRTTLAEVANWADEIRDLPWGRRLARWHYDDIALCGEADYTQYCGGGACASAQLARHLAMLGNRAVPVYRRNEALKWVVHLMGDIHQPLHASTHGDRGGNAVKVSFFGETDNAPYGPMNLHAIWDAHMPRRLIAERGGEAAIAAAPIAEADRAAWERGSIGDWVDESHRIAVNVAYAALPREFSCSGKNPTDVLTIGEDYYAAAAPVIDAQLRKAGVRLARVLNGAFAGTSER